MIEVGSTPLPFLSLCRAKLTLSPKIQPDLWYTE
jgi:hypothetical protein